MLEAEDAEVGEREKGGGEGAMKVEVFEYELGDPALEAGDTVP